MKIWIAQIDYGTEGKSAALMAFGAAWLATIYKAGADASSGSTIIITELELIEAANDQA